MSYSISQYQAKTVAEAKEKLKEYEPHLTPKHRAVFEAAIDAVGEPPPPQAGFHAAIAVSGYGHDGSDGQSSPFNTCAVTVAHLALTDE